MFKNIFYFLLFMGYSKEEICSICAEKYIAHRKNQLCCSKIKCKDRTKYLRYKPKIIERIKKWEKNNPKRAKKLHKKAFNKFLKNNRKRFNELMKKEYQRNKKKHRARVNALYNIKIKKKDKCELCGDCSKKLERHHPNYNKPLYVTLLCKQCHSSIRR